MYGHEIRFGFQFLQLFFYFLNKCHNTIVLNQAANAKNPKINAPTPIVKTPT